MDVLATADLEVGATSFESGKYAGWTQPKRARLMFLAAILTGHPDADAHFAKTRKHAVADAVAQSLFAGGALGIRESTGGCRQVVVICGNNRGLAVVVARVEDESDRVPDPLIGFLRAQVVEDQNIGGEDRLEELEFSGTDFGVIAVLDALQQFTVIAEEPATPRSRARRCSTPTARCVLPTPMVP